jgi:hypothetical protein
MSEFDTKYKVYDYVVYCNDTYKVCNIFKSELDDGVMYELRRNDKYDEIYIEFGHEDAIYLDKGVKCPECGYVCNQAPLISGGGFDCNNDDCIVTKISEPYPDIDTVFEKQGESQD